MKGVDGRGTAFFECSNSACLGDGKCQTGYTGASCTLCDVDHGRKGTYDCEKCASKAQNQLRFALGFFGVLVAVGIMLAQSAKDEEYDPKKVVQKITLSGVQTSAVGVESAFKFQAWLKSFMQAQESVGTAGSSFLQVGCLLALGSTSAFYAQCMLLLVLPLLAPVVSAMYIGMFALYKRLRNETIIAKTEARDGFVTCVLFILFLIHPTLVKQCFQMLACQRLGESDADLFLKRDHSQRCFDVDHFKWLGLVALPMLILWVAGIPVAGAVLVHRNRDNLQAPEVRACMSA